MLKDVASGWPFVPARTAAYDIHLTVGLEQIQAWQVEECIEWLGNVDDMKRLIREVAFVCLPTYREGMPKVLLKAAVAGRAVVATYVIGCREAVVPGVTGDLIQARESCSLAKALLSSIMHTWRQKAYGAEVRATAVFSVTSVVSQTLNI